jgi:sterol desaturase/sphingolipid hydroxylase (fatty acid hydroxylase superfamily)
MHNDWYVLLRVLLQQLPINLRFSPLLNISPRTSVYPRVLVRTNGHRARVVTARRRVLRTGSGTCAADGEIFSSFACPSFHTYVLFPLTLLLLLFDHYYYYYHRAEHVCGRGARLSVKI